MHSHALAFAKRLYREAQSDDLFMAAAALGFYLTLAIFPALIVLMATIPYLPVPRVDQAVMDFVRQALPGDAARLVAGIVHDVTSQRRGGLLSFGIVAALWSSSTGMYALMRQMNVAYDVEERRPFLEARLVALGLLLLFTVLVLGAFSLVVLGGVIQDWVGARTGFSPALLGFFVAFRWVVIVAGLLLGVSLTYYLAPNREQRFRYFSAGSVSATALLIATSVGFSLYVRHFGDYSAVYGSIGAVIVLMLWLYLAGVVILLGGEINVVLEAKGPASRA